MTLADIPDYQIIRQLDKREGVQVLLARHHALERDVVIKLIDVPEHADAAAIQAYQQSLRTLGGLGHPNIVPVFDTDSWPGCSYAVMAYLDGGTLAERLAQGVSESQAMRIIFQLAQGLAAAHQRGIVHGGLNPRNVLFNAEGTAAIADFGTATLLHRLRGETAPASSVYTAPEATLEGDGVDARVDVYALGVIFHQLLTGRVPFEAEGDALQTLKLAAAVTALPERQARFQPVMERMLAPVPGDRYASARVFLTELARRVQNLDASGAPVKSPKPLVAKENAAPDGPPHPSAGDASPRGRVPIQWIALVGTLLALPATAWWIEQPQSGHGSATTAHVAAEPPAPPEPPATPTTTQAASSLSIDTTLAPPTESAEPSPPAIGNAPLGTVTHAPIEETAAEAGEVPPRERPETSAPLEPATTEAAGATPLDALALTLADPLAPPASPALPTPYSATGVELLDGRVAAELIFLPGGTFQMGSPSDEAGRWRDEKAHDVTVDAFFLGRHEVTVGEFTRFTAFTGYRTEAERKSRGCYSWAESAEGGAWTWRSKRNWREPGFAQSDDHPVVCVSWNDAMAYVDWLNQQTGGGFRLPTEAEWEYAARGGTATSRFWGDDAKLACEHANVADLTIDAPGPRWAANHRCEDGQWFTAPVGGYGGHPWGFVDLLGNAWEWTCSNWDEAFKGEYRQCAQPETRGWRALRGGAWDSDARSARSAARFRNRPDYRLDTVGFRVARSLPEPTEDGNDTPVDRGEGTAPTGAHSKPVEPPKPINAPGG